MSIVWLIPIMPFLIYPDKHCTSQLFFILWTGNLLSSLKTFQKKSQKTEKHCMLVYLYIVKLKERSKAAFFVFTCVYGLFALVLNLST